MDNHKKSRGAANPGRAAMKKGLSACFLFFFLAAVGSASKVLYTTNFKIRYDPGRSTDGYIQAIGQYMEKAWDYIFNTLGFDNPKWMETDFVDVYLNDLGKKVRGRARTPIFWEKLIWNPLIAINLEKNMINHDELAATCAHEFFHLVQFGYSREEHPWLLESTAVWIEDKVFKPLASVAQHYGYLYRWDEWESYNGIPLTSTQENMEYAASSFINYLTEKKPGNVDLVKKIFEKTRKKGQNSFSALSEALGDSSAWGKETLARLGEFFATNLVQDSSFNVDYSLKALSLFTKPAGYPVHKEFPFKNDNKATMKSASLGVYDSPSIKPIKRTARPLVPDYVEIIPHKEAGSIPGNLQVAVYAPPGQDWAFHLIEKPNTGQWTVRTFPPAGKGKWSELSVAHFPKDERVFLAAVSVDPSLTTGSSDSGPSEYYYKIAALMTEPPFVTKFSLEKETDSGPETIWALGRTPETDGSWSDFGVEEEGIHFRPDGSVNIFIETSRAMSTVPELSMGGIPVPLKADPADSRTFFKGRIDINKFFSLMEKEQRSAEISVEVKGRDLLGSAFDKDPSTIPRLEFVRDAVRVSGWEGEEKKNLGGKDTLSDKTIPLYASPPYLREVKVFQSDEGYKKKGVQNLIYHAVWLQTGLADNKRNELFTKKEETYQHQRSAEIQLRFDRPLKEPKAFLSGVEIELRRAAWLENEQKKKLNLPDASEELIQGKTGAFYSGTIYSNKKIADAIEKEKKAVLKVEGATTSGLKLDANPKTIAFFDWISKQWEGYEAESKGPSAQIGGSDEWHALKGEDLSDLWFEKDESGAKLREVRITWDGDNITATTEYNGRMFTFLGKVINDQQIYLTSAFKNDSDLKRYPLKDPSLDRLLELRDTMTMGGQTGRVIVFALGYTFIGNKNMDEWRGLFMGAHWKYTTDKDYAPLKPSSNRIVWERQSKDKNKD